MTVMTKVADAQTYLDETPDRAPSAAKTPSNPRRARLFAGLAGAVAIAAVGAWGYEHFVADRHVVTDNAYVGANLAQVTPQIGAPVAQVLVDDTQTVKRGDVLVRLDDTDARIAVAQAEAQLAQTERKVRGLMATGSGLTAMIASRAADQARADAQLASAQADLDKARIDLDRRQALVASGSVSGEELTSARSAYASALANVKSAQAARAQAAANRMSATGDRDANSALIVDTTVDTNPEVLAVDQDAGGTAASSRATMAYGSSASGITCKIATSMIAVGWVRSSSFAAWPRMVAVSRRSASMYPLMPASVLSSSARACARTTGS